MCRAADELSGHALLTKLLADQDLTDVFLQASDGKRIPANRCILAVKSEVFKKMLYGKFEEASNRVVKIEFDGTVLKAVVEYCYKDTAEILKVKKDWQAETPLKQLQRLKQLQSLVKLFGAAAYLNLPGLEKKALETLNAMLKTNPSLSFAMLEAGYEAGPAFPKEMREIAMNEIRHNRDISFNAEWVSILSPDVLEEILSDDGHRMPEMDLFNILHLWADGNGGGDGGDTRDNRHKIASEFTKHIRLELIDPVHLAEKVSSSDLVSQEQLLQAYKSHAVAASEAKGRPERRARCMAQWKDSSSDVIGSIAETCEVQLLDYPEITSGVHQWMVQVEEVCDSAWLGVAHTGLSLDMKRFLGAQRGGWVYGKGGTTHGAGQIARGFPKFAVGSKITFTLNLLMGGEGNGILSTAVDGGTPSTLFTDLRSILEGKEGGFVPAASLCNPGRVRMLCVQKLEDRE